MTKLTTIGVLAVMVLSACAPRIGQRSGEWQREDQPAALEVGTIVATSIGQRVPLDRLIGELHNADVIYVGETHTNQADHNVQLKILETLHAANPHIVLAMEMFPRRAQRALDGWTSGRLTEEQFLKESDWAAVWGYPFALYRDLLLFAREHRLKVVGLNAPPEVVREVGRRGLASLTPAQRAEVARDFDHSNANHRQSLLEQYSRHAQLDIQGFESFYDAQLTWEETMAETLAVEIAARPPGEQIVALIGNGHIAYRYGVPERALRRQNHSYRTVVTLTAPVASSSVTTDIADYVWVTATAPPPAFRGGLGIFAREAGEGEGILVVGVIPGGPAAQGDIRKGDILVSMDDHPLRRVEELTAILSASPPAAVHRFLLRRGAAVETATVSMPGAD